MPRPAYLQLNTLDDRREVHQLLARLPPRRRVDFLNWCCRQIRNPVGRTCPHVSPRTLRLLPAARRDDEADQQLTNELFYDWWYLCAQHDLDQAAATQRLVELVRHQRR